MPENWKKPVCVSDRTSGGFLLRSLLIGAVALVAVACDGSTDKASASVDACKLIDKSTARAILGTEVTPKPVDATALGKNSASLCHYGSGTLHGGFMLIVGPLKTKKSMAEEATEQKAKITADFKKNINITPTIEDIPDLGEAAYAVKTSVDVQLHVLNGNYAIVIGRTTPATPQVMKETEDLARAALKNLK